MSSTVPDAERDRVAEMFANLRRRDPSDRYEWHHRPGHNFKGDAHVIGTHLEKLSIEHGDQLDTAVIVEDAQDINSPLYPLFEHDTEIAARKWWAVQARNLVKSIHIVKVLVNADGSDTIINTPAYYSASVNQKRTYVNVHVVARVPELKDQVVERLMVEARIFADKARNLGLFAAIVAEIDKLEGALTNPTLEEYADAVSDVLNELEDESENEGDREEDATETS